MADHDRWEQLEKTARLREYPVMSMSRPADGNNVVIAIGNQVFVTTNALAAAVTFTNITRNLPSRNIARA